MKKNTTMRKTRSSTSPARSPGAVKRHPIRLAFKVLLPVVVVMLAGMAFLALARSKPEIKPRVVPEKASTVEAVKVLVATHRPRIKLYGETVAGRRVDLRALVAGEIARTSSNFRLGGIVTKGDMLLAIDPFNYKASLAEARANLAEARAKLKEIRAREALELVQISATRSELKLAARDFTRAKNLFKQRLVSQKNVDDKQFTMSQRRQSLAQRTANLAIERARATQQDAALIKLQSLVRRAERDLKNTNLVAPFNAYISAINAETGRMVGLNDTIATLIDADRIDVRFNFSNAQFGRLIAGNHRVVGKPVSVVWRVGNTSLTYKAVIERVAAQITASTGGVEVYARLQGSKDMVLLRPGAFVEILIDDASFHNVARLPETALYDGETVFVVNGKHRLEARKVKLMGYSESDILVRGALKSGERVITTRISQAKDGLLVVVK